MTQRKRGQKRPSFGQIVVVALTGSALVVLIEIFVHYLMFPVLLHRLAVQTSHQIEKHELVPHNGAATRVQVQRLYDEIGSLHKVIADLKQIVSTLGQQPQSRTPKD